MNYWPWFILTPIEIGEVAKRGEDEDKKMAVRTLVVSEQMRTYRSLTGLLPTLHEPMYETKWRSVYDAEHKIPATRLARDEGDSPTGDVQVDEAYENSGHVYDFYHEVFGRRSVDGRGMKMEIFVYYGENFANALWNGRQMIYGAGSGNLFNRFTKPIDVTAHELTHGVTQHEANFNSYQQSGALNEHFCDAFAIIMKQWLLRQTVFESNWLIGEGLFTSKVNGIALRSLKEPGSAYDDPILGRDPQVSHMANYVDTIEDNGGVHINSGIPNKAFYIAATESGGFAWEKIGKIWYTSLKLLRRDAIFQDLADITSVIAKNLFGEEFQRIINAAWKKVGIDVRRDMRYLLQ